MLFGRDGAAMKQVLILALLCLLLTTGAAADFEPETDYMALMTEAAMAGDEAAGLAAEARRAEKIAALGLDYAPVSYAELSLLSRVIHAEAGSEWLGMEWKMSVGEVVLNRIASPEFPDTMQAVIEQPGQYYGKNSRYLQTLLPSRGSVEAAARLLSGERVLSEPAVVFQSNRRLGGGLFRELRDRYLGSTYLCYSSHRELYAA